MQCYQFNNYLYLENVSVKYLLGEFYRPIGYTRLESELVGAQCDLQITNSLIHRKKSFNLCSHLRSYSSLSSIIKIFWKPLLNILIIYIRSM